jgi:hypothetical protein
MPRSGTSALDDVDQELGQIQREILYRTAEREREVNGWSYKSERGQAGEWGYLQERMASDNLQEALQSFASRLDHFVACPQSCQYKPWVFYFNGEVACGGFLLRQPLVLRGFLLGELKILGGGFLL